MCGSHVCQDRVYGLVMVVTEGRPSGANGAWLDQIYFLERFPWGSLEAHSYTESRALTTPYTHDPPYTHTTPHTHTRPPHTYTRTCSSRGHSHLPILTGTHHTHGLPSMHEHMHAHTTTHTCVNRHTCIQAWSHSRRRKMIRRMPDLLRLSQRRGFKIPSRADVQENSVRTEVKEVGSVHFLECLLSGALCSGGKCSFLSLIHQTEEYQFSASNN